MTFSSTRGPRLAGVIELPKGEVRGWGVFAHGFTLGKDCPAASRICKRLAADGIGMLRYDNLGIGDSEGDWGDGSFSQQVDGHGAGGGVHERLRAGRPAARRALVRRRRRDRRRPSDSRTVRAVVSIGAPYEPGHVEHNYDALVSGSWPTARRRS